MSNGRRFNFNNFRDKIRWLVSSPPVGRSCEFGEARATPHLLAMREDKRAVHRRVAVVIRQLVADRQRVAVRNLCFIAAGIVLIDPH